MSHFIAILLALRMMGIPASVQTFSVSAYVNSGGVYPFAGLTASGQYTRPGVAACGPNLPFGTALYVDGVGWLHCADRGGAITEGFVDVWMESENAALAFGRKTLPAIIVREER